MQSGLTYDDVLGMFPEETKRRVELIGGELLMAASPALRHERVVKAIFLALHEVEREAGGEVLAGVLDIRLTDSDMVQPDVVYFGEALPPGHPVDAVPDLVVEVSSPSTRGVDRGRKRDLYEREGVGEYWFVDLERDLIEVHRRAGEVFGQPEVFGRDAVLESGLLEGLRLDVGGILGPEP